MRCQRCGGEQFTKAGFNQLGQQIYGCSACRRRQSAHAASAFRGYRFPEEIIALGVRWYLRYRLSYADTSELLAERGVHVDPATICAWVQHFTPLYMEAARRYRHKAGKLWHVDETYVRIAGQWCHAYRAVDERGQVIDVYVSPARDTVAATAFFTQALTETEVRPHTVTTDKAAAYPPALRVVLPEADHITGKMVQQTIERDHHQLKGRTRTMRGFQTLVCAQVVCAGHGFMRIYAMASTIWGSRLATRASRKRPDSCRRGPN
jgi:transposase-like protein